MEYDAEVAAARTEREEALKLAADAARREALAATTAAAHHRYPQSAAGIAAYDDSADADELAAAGGVFPRRLLCDSGIDHRVTLYTSMRQSTTLLQWSNDRVEHNPTAV